MSEISSPQHTWNDIFSVNGRVFDEPLAEVIQFATELQKTNLRRVLDLGCGTGRHMVYLEKLGFEVWGLDNAPAGIQMTKEWLSVEHLLSHLVLADVHSPFPFSDEAFDVLISTRVIHHAIQAKAIGAVHEIIRVLRKGGELLITLPGGSKRDTTLQWIEPHTYIPLDGREKGIPHYVFSGAKLHKMFDGFTKIDISSQENELIVVKGKK